MCGGSGGGSGQNETKRQRPREEGRRRDSDTGKECCDDGDGWRGDLTGALSVCELGWLCRVTVMPSSPDATLLVSLN